MTKKNVVKNKSVSPKRKLGRYVILFALAVPVFMQLRHMNIAFPEFHLPQLSIQSDVEFTNVIVDGDFFYSSKKQLQSYLSSKLKDDFVRLDLSEIQTHLLENSWYRNVSVSRVWPASLKVEIEEEQPIARWGDKGFVNRYGEIVLSGDTKLIDHLPLLVGQSDEAYDIAKSYLTMSQVLVDHQLYITKLRVSENNDWLLEINHDFGLALGDRNISARIERFLFLYEEQLAPLIGDVESVDMRYQNGVAVKWSKHALVGTKTRNSVATR